MHPVLALSGGSVTWYVARDGCRHPRVSHRERAARDLDVVPLEQPHVAALRRRVRAPQCLAAGARVPRHPCGDGCRRLVRTDPVGRRGGPLRVGVPAILAWPRRRRRRPPHRAGGDQPLAPSDRLHHLAIRALACVRVLAGRGVARPRYRLRYEHRAGTGVHRRVRRRGAGCRRTARRCRPRGRGRVRARSVSRRWRSPRSSSSCGWCRVRSPMVGPARPGRLPASSPRCRARRRRAPQGRRRPSPGGKTAPTPDRCVPGGRVRRHRQGHATRGRDRLEGAGGAESHRHPVERRDRHASTSSSPARPSPTGACR